MVVHTPSKLDILRQTAAATAAGRRAIDGAEDAGDVPPSVLAAAQGATGVVDGETQATAAFDGSEVAGDVPPSVLAAAQAQGAAGGSQVAAATPVEHDFDAWNGDVPPGAQTERVDAEREKETEHINANVTVRKRGGRVLTSIEEHDDREDLLTGDGDDIRNAGQVPPTMPSGLNPFTPEWFAQIIGAAATAAATAVATANASQPSPRSAPPGAAPRRLNDRKVPDFWEDRPEFWFRIFDAHLAHFNPTEKRCFDALLPLLTPAARSVVHAVIGSPGASPHSRARDALLRHFGQTPRQKAREAREARSLGDKLPSEFLDRVISLLPDVKMFYEIALLDALPSNARVAALGHSDVRAMALAADAVVLENRAVAEVDRPVATVASLHTPDLGQDVAQASPVVAAVGRGPRPAQKSSLCTAHARWGKETYKCQAPATCKMRSVIRPRPSPPASGNGKAGGQ